jgi:hypothetical protein
MGVLFGLDIQKNKLIGCGARGGWSGFDLQEMPNGNHPWPLLAWLIKIPG